MTTTEAVKVFIDNAELPWQELGGGVKRKIMAYDDRLMLVKVAFETGGVGAVHQHVHTQITHVESGRFEIEIAGEKKILQAGDAFFIPSNVWHGAVCIEEGILIDTFSPAREDFIEK